MTIPKINRELVERKSKESLDIDKIKEAWVRMSLENPYLFSAISDTVQSISTDTKVQNGFLKGAYLIWSLLNDQEEIDEMNENWGF